MEYTAKEVEIAFKYFSGEINDIQLNFLISQNNIDINKIEQIIKKISRTNKVIRFLFFMLAAFFIFGFFKLIF